MLVSSRSVIANVEVIRYRTSILCVASAVLSIDASTGASLTAVMLMSRVCVLLFALAPSLTVKLTVRVAVDGLSLGVGIGDRSQSGWYWASVAEPLRVKVPLVGSTSR